MKYLLLCFFVLAACSPADENCSQDNNGEFESFTYPDAPKVREAPPQVNQQVSYFNTCAEIVDYALQTKELSQSYTYSGVGKNQCGQSLTNFLDAIATPEQDGSNLNQPTNTQEGQVDEADRVKISKKYIFYTRENSIEVLDRETKNTIQSISAVGHWRPYIYVYNETLVVIRSHGEPFIYDDVKNDQVLHSPLPVYVKAPEKFDIIFYNVENEITEIGYKTVAGYYKNSRLSGDGLLTIITSISLAPDQTRKRNLNHVQSLLSHVDCSQVARPGVTDLDHTLTSVNSFNVATLKPAQAHKQTHLLGRYDTIYQNKDLYLTKRNVDWFWWDQCNTLDRYTNITTRLEEKNDKWNIHSRFEFQGEILGPWSFKEQGDYLFVATTQNPEPGGGSATHLEVFRKNKKDTLGISGVSGIAPGETLRSARFTDDYAYLVTFLTTDPLFVIDIRNPEAPKVVSELKIPGFSSYLHTTDDNRLIGVGYQSWSLQLSLFDVLDPTLPKTLEQLVVADSSSSSAQRNHHSFFFDNQWQLMGLPVETETYAFNWAESLRFTGAYFYDLSENTFDPVGKVSHSDWVQSICPRYNQQSGQHLWTSVPGSKDVSRVHRIGDELMTFSDFGLRVHDPENPNQEFKRTLFNNAEESCPKPYAVCTIILGE